MNEQEIPAVVTATDRPVAARNARDWRGVADALTPDYVMVDRRPAGAGEIHGPEAFVEYLRALRDLVPDSTVSRVAIHAVEGDVAVIEYRTAGMTEEGSEIVIGQQTVAVARDGLLARVEFFPPEALDQALDRFRELTAGASSDDT